MSGDAAADEALAARARQGDRRAFDLLVARFKSPLYRFIRRYVGDSDDAYDVLQETFVAAWRALRRYDPARSFAAWIRTIALNKCRDFGRRTTSRRLIQELFAREPKDAASEAEAESPAASEQERLAQLDLALSSLPPKYKEPLLLTALEGLSHQDAAKLLHLTPKAIEMRIYRARKLLGERLGTAESP